MNNPIVIITLIAVAVAVVLYLTRPKHALELVIRKSKIVKFLGLTKRQFREAEEFFSIHFPKTEQIRITAVRHSNRLKFRIAGDIDAGQIQQIRNFMVDIS